MKIYKIGQIFENTYEPEAAMWCNTNGLFMAELKSQNGKRIFQIQAIPEAPLEEVKLQKIEELKTVRNIREEAPVEYLGKLWDFDSKSRDRINAAATALEVGGIEKITWTSYDDTSLELSVTDLKTIIAVAALRGDSLHKKYRELRDLVNSFETVEEVKALTWSD